MALFINENYIKESEDIFKPINEYAVLYEQQVAYSEFLEGFMLENAATDKIKHFFAWIKKQFLKLIEFIKGIIKKIKDKFNQLIHKKKAKDSNSDGKSGHDVETIKDDDVSVEPSGQKAIGQNHEPSRKAIGGGRRAGIGQNHAYDIYEYDLDYIFNKIEDAINILDDIEDNVKSFCNGDPIRSMNEANALKSTLDDFDEDNWKKPVESKHLIQTTPTDLRNTEQYQKEADKVLQTIKFKADRCDKMAREMNGGKDPGDDFEMADAQKGFKLAAEAYNSVLSYLTKGMATYSRAIMEQMSQQARFLK